MKFKALVLFSLIASALFLSGCNTLRGMGEDIEAAGQAIQRETND